MIGKTMRDIYQKKLKMKNKHLLLILLGFGLIGCATDVGEGFSQQRKSLPIFGCLDIGEAILPSDYGLTVRAEFVEGRNYPVIHFLFKSRYRYRQVEINTLNFTVLNSQSKYMFGPTNSSTWENTSVTDEFFNTAITWNESRLSYLDKEKSFLNFLKELKNSENEIERASFQRRIGINFRGGYNNREFIYQARDKFDAPILGITKGQTQRSNMTTLNLGSLCFYHENLDKIYEEYIDGIQMLTNI